MDKGKWLEQKFQSWLSEIECYSYKPIDFKSLMYLISSFPNIRDKIPQVPCDRIVIYKGKSYFFEMKYTQGKSLNISMLKAHQIGALLNHEEKGGGKSFIVIGLKKKGIFALRIKDVTYFLSLEQRKSLSYIYINSLGKLLQNSADLLSLLENNVI
jgi:penicillin-binding protein-related factor A (putative recombinase)